MPRHPDPFLEDEILDAAAGLWRKGGDKVLTIRAVARALLTAFAALLLPLECGRAERGGPPRPR
jgi:hypothetical protein